MLWERLCKLFETVTGRSSCDITKKTKIDDTAGFSSLGKIRLICAIEDEFDIEIPNSALKKFKHVGDVVSYLEKVVK